MVLWGLVKELRIAAEDTRPLVVSGPLAAQLEKELSRGAAPGAVRFDGRPEDAAVFVRVLAGAPTAEDEKLLREADRAKVPVVAVQTGTEVFDIPYVLATEVVMCSPGSGFPVEEIAARHRGAARGVRHGARREAAGDPRAVERGADREVLAPERDRRGGDLRPGRRLPGADAEPDPARASARGRTRGRGRPGSLARGARDDRRRARVPCSRPPGARRNSRGRLAREGRGRVRGHPCGRRGRAPLFPHRLRGKSRDASHAVRAGS